MSHEKRTYDRPAGCNVFVVDERADFIDPECGNCGRIMTTDPTSFDDVHERRELEGIARIEAEHRKKGGV